MSRMHSQAGIAIGPILFVLALLGIIAIALSSNVGQFGTASITDRVAADIQTQANLIQAKINECNILYGTNNNFDGYPPSDTSNGTLVSAVNCNGDAAGQQNIWTGARATQLPPPSAGFSPWMYINTNGSGMGGSATGGRCVWTAPTSSNPGSNTGLVAGLTKAAGKFTNAASNDGVSSVNYNPASADQKFVLWITLPTGTPDSHCVP
jgi:hypothetical protein